MTPYEILGITEKADDAAVKAAYRALAAKYSTGLYAPGREYESEGRQKMAQIDAAYDSIVNSRSASQPVARGSVYSAGGGDNFNDIRSYISAGRLDEAQTLLDGIPQDQRTPEWFFLMGELDYRRGWLSDAFNCYETAWRGEPDNEDYRQAYENMKAQRDGAGDEGRQKGGDDLCLPCCIALPAGDCCCHCMGGSCC